jgi:hypothetical protein
MIILEFKWKNFRVKIYILIFILKYKKLKCPFLQTIIIFWIEILIFGFENISVKFKYQILDQISVFKFKLKISCSNPKSKIQIMF